MVVLATILWLTVISKIMLGDEKTAEITIQPPGCDMDRTIATLIPGIHLFDEQGFNGRSYFDPPGVLVKMVGTSLNNRAGATLCARGPPGGAGLQRVAVKKTHFGGMWNFNIQQDTEEGLCVYGGVEGFHFESLTTGVCEAGQTCWWVVLWE